MGKYNHEETRSTFSRSATHTGAVVVVRDMDESKNLAKYITGTKTQAQFEEEFKGKFTNGFVLTPILRS